MNQSHRCLLNSMRCFVDVAVGDCFLLALLSRHRTQRPALKKLILLFSPPKHILFPPLSFSWLFSFFCKFGGCFHRHLVKEWGISQKNKLDANLEKTWQVQEF